MMYPWHMSWYGQTWGINPLLAVGVGLIALVVALLVIALKGYSLWYSARRGEKWWFVALLVINTMGILELVYLFFVVKIDKNFRPKDNLSETKSDQNQNTVTNSK